MQSHLTCQVSIAVSLQISTVIISTLRNHLEIRCRERVAFSVEPTIEAHIKTAIHHDVTTQIFCLSINLYGITSLQLITCCHQGSRLSVLVVGILDDNLILIANHGSRVGKRITCSILLNSDITQYLPCLTATSLSHNRHTAVHFAILIIPFQDGQSLLIIIFHREIGRGILFRCLRHKIIFTIISHRRLHCSIVLTSRCQSAIIETGYRSLTIPVIIALHIIPIIQIRTDTFQCSLHL